MGTLRERHRSAAVRFMVCVAVGLLAAPAFGQATAEPPVLVPRVAGPGIQAVALVGDRVGSGQLQSINVAYMNRQGEIAFEATLVQDARQREGLFTWSGGAVTPLALEGEETGFGPLVLTDPEFGFRQWVWGNGSQALFLGAADANHNGVFDPGVDPQFLFLAEGGRLIPLLHIGDRMDGGTLLSILSFRVNGQGQMAFQALIDRDGDGQFTRGVALAGYYLLDNGRIHPLMREGDRAGDGVIHYLDLRDLQWQFDDRGEMLLGTIFLEVPGALSQAGEALVLTDRTGVRLLERSGLPTGFGTFDLMPYASLNKRGDVAFLASTLAEEQGQGYPRFRLFRIESGAPGSRLEMLAQPGDPGPDQSPIGDIVGDRPAIANDGSVAFHAAYPQPTSFVEGQVLYPVACFIQRPEFRYEVIRVGEPSPWGVIGLFGQPALNDLAQAALEVNTAMYPFDPVDGPLFGPKAIVFWKNGIRIGVVGAGDIIPGGQVGITTHLIGLSNNGRLAFETTVTDEQGVSRGGIFVALVPGEG